MISIVDFFGWIGALVSICFFISPIFKYLNLMKKKINYKDINIIIIVGNYISSLVWLIYGYENKIKQITVCFSLGALISFIWILIYLVHMGKDKMTHALIYTMILSSLTFAIFIILEIIINDKKILGEVCFIVCSLSYISPTQLLIKVLNSKNHKKIPIYSAIISAIGYGSWTLFGLFKFNGNIIIPNLVGLGFALAQIILYRIYKYKKPLTEELGNISQSVIGTMKNVADKTVEIVNSITPISNIQISQNNSAAPPNINANPQTNKDLKDNDNIGNNNIDFNNSNENNNKMNGNNGENSEVKTETNFNTNLVTNVNDNNKKENDNDFIEAPNA